MNIEESLLKQIADNPALLAAVKAKILEPFDSFHLWQIGRDQTNDQLGAIIRARLEGLQLVEEGFKEIEKYKTVDVKPEAVNQAR